MNFLIVVEIAAGGLLALWVVQSIALKLVGEPLALPLRYTTEAPSVRYATIAMTYVIWLAILIGTPLAVGVSPVDAAKAAFSLPVPWRGIAIAFAVTFAPALVIYPVYVRLGWFRLGLQYDQKTRRAKLLRRFIGPLPLATLEEGVFRGVILEELLQSLPHSQAYTALAIVVSSVVFSAVHFIKRGYPGKPVWQPAFGLFIVGCLCGLAYVLGGRTLWLPIVVHATLVFVCQTVRLYGVYLGPPWLVGYEHWPQCGLIGSFYVLSTGIALAMLI